MKYSKGCKSCMSNKGTKRISPAIPIYKGKYWIVEHAYPCGMKGWLVMLPKRHVESLHELSDSENREFGVIFPKIIKILHKETDSEKEYIFQIAKAQGFKHIHFHIVSKDRKLPEKYEGVKIFGLKNDLKTLNKTEIIKFCDKMRKRLKKR